MTKLTEAEALVDEALRSANLTPYVESRLRELEGLLEPVYNEAYDEGRRIGYDDGYDANECWQQHCYHDDD